jgi:hypothetical protein
MCRQLSSARPGPLERRNGLPRVGAVAQLRLCGGDAGPTVLGTLLTRWVPNASVATDSKNANSPSQGTVARPWDVVSSNSRSGGYYLLRPFAHAFYPRAIQHAESKNVARFR